MVRTSAKHKMKIPWVTIGLCKSTKKLSKLYKKLIGQEGSSYEVRKYKITVKCITNVRGDLGSDTIKNSLIIKTV